MWNVQHLTIYSLGTAVSLRPNCVSFLFLIYIFLHSCTIPDIARILNCSTIQDGRWFSEGQRSVRLRLSQLVENEVGSSVVSAISTELPSELELSVFLSRSAKRTSENHLRQHRAGENRRQVSRAQPLAYIIWQLYILVELCLRRSS